jgi:hypothetical protein
MHSMRRTLPAALVVAASLLTLAVTAAPAAAQSKCTAAQYKAMGKKYLSKLKCYSKAVTQNVPVDVTCLQTAEGKFATKWAAAVGKGDCVNAASEAQGESSVDACVDVAEALLQPPPVCPVDGSATACEAVSVAGACADCCGGIAGCGTCFEAVGGSCTSPLDNTDCANAINAAGCADECCPW